MKVPFLTTDQMREVDRLMIEEYGIELIQMMENAGRNLATAGRDLFLAGDPAGRRVTVLSGSGGNGGGGLVAARRLIGWGAEVTVWLTKEPDDYTGVPAHQLDILRKLDADIRVADRNSAPLALQADLILDAIIGYSLSGPPRGSAADLIQAANSADASVLSLDAPSGVDTTTGHVHEPAVQAAATLTLALPKAGLQTDEARPYVGDLYLADIGVPSGLYARPSLGLDVDPIFATQEIVRVW
jgi:NAD(P)H-hydrate epimerase